MTSVPLDCLLIADDLTGACDAGVYFGATVLVAPDAHAPAARVIVLSTDSRDLAPEGIYKAMARAAAAFPPHASARVFKKIDSTLRGNTGLEIALAMEAFQCDAAVVCPSFPAMQRVVEHGVLRVTSAPEFAPIDLSALLAQQSGLPCAHTAPDGVSALLVSGVPLVSVDANCDSDLDRIAAAILPLGRRILWAGSAGLASALARLLGANCLPPTTHVRPGPVLFCVGSNHPVTLAQQAALMAERSCIVLPIPRGLISADEVRERITKAPAAALFLSGGDTASLVCRAVGVQRIELCGEIVAGVPRGILRGGPFDGLPVVTKSGGFGQSDTLIQVADYFSCLNQPLP